MMTILEYAQLSAHIYDTTQGGYGTLTINHATSKHIPQEKSSWYIMTDVDSHLIRTNHFYAQLYMKFNKGVATDAIVAIRGTVAKDITNIGVDFLSWCTDTLGEGSHDIKPFIFTNLAVSFVTKAHNYVRKYFPNISHLKFTGHSLGGALAQLMPLQAGFLGETVVFNSPGVGNLPGIIKQNSNWITNVNSHYGFINKIGKVLGKLYVVDVPNMETEAKQLHALMDQDDYKTSEQLYRIADSFNSKNKIISLLFLASRTGIDEIAAGARLKSYISTYNSFNQMPQNMHAISVTCKSTDPSIARSQWNNLLNVGKVIVAQHSIDNMVPALQRKENASVAYMHI